MDCWIDGKLLLVVLPEIVFPVVITFCSAVQIGRVGDGILSRIASHYQFE
jgi:hypothetical protein